jgi:hypothetical protein
MFLVRSAFWLTLVFSAMPFERSEIARPIDQTQAGPPAGAAATAKTERPAVASKAPDGSPVTAGRPSPATTPARPLAAQEARDKAGRQSADCLTAEDRAPSWRGRASNSGA